MSTTQTVAHTGQTHEEAQPKIPIPSTLKYRPLPAPLDEATNVNMPSVIKQIDAPGVYPCRKCLQDGKVGEKMRLFSYDPWLGNSPYRQSGPIFVHEQPQCKLAEFSNGSYLPEQQRKRQLAVRAFNHNNMMVAFDLIEGSDLVTKAEELFKQDGEGHAEYVHVHYPGPGCFAVRIDRGE